MFCRIKSTSTRSSCSMRWPPRSRPLARARPAERRHERVAGHRAAGVRSANARQIVGRRRVVERLDTDDWPHEVLQVRSGEGAAHQVARKLVADRRHDNALVEGEVEGRYDTGLNVDRVA